jgi:polyisoprenyl-phosphate glycosyltransferase
MSGPPAKLDAFVTVVAPVVGGWSVMSRFVVETTELLRAGYANYELILVDSQAESGVLDGLLRLLKDVACIRLVRLSQPATREVMFLAGLEGAIGDYVVALTPGVDPPCVIPELVATLDGGPDIVCGVSVAPPRSPLARLGSRALHWYGRRYLGLAAPPDATDLVAFTRRSVNALTRTQGRHRRVRHLSRQIGFRTAVFHYWPEQPYPPPARRLRDSLRLVRDTAVSSSHPLRAVGLLGLLVAAINLGRTGYAFLADLVGQRADGSRSGHAFESAIMFFVLFAVVAVICEYVGRLVDEVRGQPVYHIMEELNSTVVIADEASRNVTA